MLGDQDTIQGWEPEGPRDLVEKGKTQSPQRHVVCEERQRIGAAKRDANNEERRKAGQQLMPIKAQGSESYALHVP